MLLSNFLSVENIFFELWNYPMSYLEFFGTIFTGASVYLAAKNKTISWPIGIMGVVLYLFLFFQIQLYSDFLEQIYYLITGFWGWRLWSKPKNKKERDKTGELKVSFGERKSNLLTAGVVVLASIIVGIFMAKIHLIWPKIFTIEASFPFWDSLTTVMSFTANIYLMKRKVESWYLWIIVDIIGVILYFEKGVIFLSILYFAFLINAFKGYVEWMKIYKSYEKI